ncbi:multiheme c-type cytochrome [Ferruginibacter sp.]
MMKHPKIFFVVSLLMGMLLLFSKCINSSNESYADARGEKYAGAATCMGCHKDIVTSFAHNGHYKTSSPVDNRALKKLVTAANSIFYFMDSSHITIEEKDSVLGQTYFSNGKETVSHKFDIAFGSAEKAQTYAYWQADKLLELPLTYFTAMHTWANSPGFTINHANYNRVIESRCFECHASYVSKEFVQSGALKVSEKLDPASIIYGIDCERCHGPAADHVQYQQQHPDDKKAKFITSISALSRQQQLDVCAVCHSGNDQSTQRSVFGFVPGDTLSNFYFPDFGSGNNEPDVHGKQLQMLQSSKCFQLSQMTCNTCHNNHQEQNTQSFISTCMNCHQSSAHAVGYIKQDNMNSKILTVNKNCIDCHMPLQPSKTIYFNSSAGLKNLPYLLRTHRIAVYK